LTKYSIPEEKIAEIKQRNDIVEIIGEYLPLQRAGKNFRALCPFHSEKTPSFMVSPERQSYHCFGCGEGGNVFSFLMKREGFGFLEAVRQLAARTGVSLPQRGEGPDDAFSGKLILYEVLQAAADFYHQNLIKSPAGEVARKYLAGRHIPADSIEKFYLGYAPNSWEALLAFGRRKGFTPEQMEAVGLIVPRKEASPQKSGYYDRFRHRLLFPLVDLQGRVVGFGGRALGDDEPKYLNSPETVLYSKGSTLFGLNLAKEEIRKQGFCYLVEGYFDLLRLYQEGLNNVAAVCGTALTPMQAKTLKRYAPKVIIIFDADPAGMAAALRGIEVLVEEETVSQGVVLSAGKDPDDYIEQYGKEAFLEEVKKARNVVEFALEQLILRHDIKTPEGKAAISAEVFPLLRKVKNKIEQAEYLRYLSDKIGVPLEAFYAEFAREKSRGDRLLTPTPPHYQSTPASPGPEELLLLLAVLNRDFSPQVLEKVEEGDLKDPVHKQIYLLIKKAQEHGTKDLAGELLLSEDAQVRKKVSQFLMRETELSNPEKIFQDCLSKIKLHKVHQQMKELNLKIKEAEKEAKQKDDYRLVKELLAEKNALSRKIDTKVW
jgi:DNA primase